MTVSKYILALFLLSICAAFSQQKFSVKVTESEYGKKWPFTVSEGTILCETIPNQRPNIAILTFKVGSKEYALNGLAKARMEKRGFKDIVEIWKDDPEIPGAKVSVGPMIARGLKLAEKQ